MLEWWNFWCRLRPQTKEREGVTDEEIWNGLVAVDFDQPFLAH